MFKCLIIEDEIPAKEFLEKLIGNLFSNKLSIVDSVANIEDAIITIEKTNPDLVFLDIELKNEKGFDLFKYFDNPSFETVFISAHSKYGVEACKKEPFDFLVKPVNYIDLREVIVKYERKMNTTVVGKSNNFSPINHVAMDYTKFNKITFPVHGGYVVEDLANVLYCEASDNYATVHFADGRKILVTKTLKYLEEYLSSDIFCRIHKSYLVNLNHVSKYSRDQGYHVVLSSGKVLDVSFRKNETLVKLLVNK